jgi:hypothetical protein
MSFFGLTALGPQNAFATAAKQARTLHIFEQDDFQRAWDGVIGKAQQCRLDQLEEIMVKLYRGPVPSNDKDAICARFEEQSKYFEIEGILTYVQYMRLMIELSASSEREERSYDGKLKPNWYVNCD